MPSLKYAAREFGDWTNGTGPRLILVPPNHRFSAFPATRLTKQEARCHHPRNENDVFLPMLPQALDFPEIVRVAVGA